MNRPPHLRAHKIGAISTAIAGTLTGLIGVYVAYRGENTAALVVVAAALLFILISGAIAADYQRRLKDHYDL